MYNLDELEDYDITIYGDVINKKPRKYLGRIDKKTGKVYVVINGKTYRVAYLVAQKFIPNPLGLSQVFHKDFNTLNNNVDNLEWV